MENNLNQVNKQIQNIESISLIDLVNQKQKKLKNLLLNDFLSDTILVNKTSGKEYPCHCVILASGSKYFYFNFLFNIPENSNSSSEPKQLHNQFLPSQIQTKENKFILEMPSKINSKMSSLEDDSVLSLMLKYLYNNNKIKKIEEEIKDSNIFSLLSLAHCFDIPKLKKHLSKIIKEKILNESNCVRIFNESLLFENVDLENESMIWIKNSFDRITKNLDEFSMMLELPYDIFSKLISSDDISLSSEKDICDMVMNYIKLRKKITERNKSVNIPNVEENKRYEQIKKDEGEVEGDGEEATNKQKNIDGEGSNKEENELNSEPKKETESRSKTTYNNYWKNHIEEIKNKFIKKLLTKEQERILVESIRFSFLSHSELLSLSIEPDMSEHRDLILEGFSIRLNTYENTQSQTNHQLKINTKSRKYLQINKQPPEGLQPSIKLNYDEDIVNFKNSNNNNMFASQNTKQKSITLNNNLNSNNYLTHSNPRPPQDNLAMTFTPNFNSSADQYNNDAKRIVEFTYDYDFDENGVFFYLGSLGKSTIFRNPHEIGQVKILSSSVGKGILSDLVSREMFNLRTLNEHNSYFGVDLGEERFLNPSCYSIRNRNSSSHVMLCWILQGSNDKVNFETLDTRIFSHKDNRINVSQEKERSMLKTAGCTSTWGIDVKIIEKFPKGFRYFIIKQIDKNSSGGFNLAISGLELYGKGNGRWFFK